LKFKIYVTSLCCHIWSN